jgi:sodium transport system permease protein
VSPALILWRKELVDALRDRRTLVAMVVVPMLLYPMMLFGMGEIIVAGRAHLAEERIEVALLDDEAVRLLPAEMAPARTSFARMSRHAAEEGIRAGKRVGAAVALAPGARAAFDAGEPVHLALLYTQRHDFSIEARDRMRTLLQKLGIQFVEQRLASAHLPPQYARPLDTEEEDIDFHKDVGPLVAAHVLPMIFLVMLFVGSFYAAIDVTAGEKERGTLETLLVAPVRTLQVMLGKYAAVSTIAIFATLMNLGAMAATFRIGVSLGEETRASVALTAQQAAVILASLIPAALLISALSLAVASLARSYREGQSLLTPLMIVGLVPGIAAQMPGIELTDATAWVPLLNVGLLIKAVVLGNVTGRQLAASAASIVACALISLWLASNAFRSESIRFGAKGGWRDLFRIR